MRATSLLTQARWLPALVLLLSFLIAAPAAEAQGQTVRDILVQGNQRIEAQTVLSYMVIRAGDRYDPERVDRSLKALFATGLFADVAIRRAGPDLVVSLVENPIINRLAFEGNRRISDDVLEQEVQLRPRVVYTRSRVQSDAQRLVEVYRRNGRFAASVEPKVIQLEQNRVDLVFEITEGEVTEIRKIDFIGNRVFNDNRLRRAIATKESRWYRFLSSEDNYDPDRLTLDRELLRKYYLARGYADFRVVSAVAELSRDRSDFFITFTVEEGEQYRFGKIDLTTELRDLDPNTLRDVMTSFAGETYNAEEIENTIQALTFAVGERGYAFVDIEPRIQRDRERRIIDVVFAINEGPRVYVERINVTGNVRTLDKVIRREFRLVEGDAFNTAKLRRSRQRIRSLGFFDRVSLTREEGTRPDRVVINTEVSERPTGEISFGAGISSSEALVGDVSIRERNLLGRGQDLRASLSLSTRRQQIDVSFTEPYFLDKNVAAGIDVFNIRRDLQSRSSFDEERTGFRLRATYSITEHLRNGLRYTLSQHEIGDIDDSTSLFIQAEEGSRLTSAVGYDLTYDRRDDRFEPTEGWVMRGGQDFAGLGGDVSYIRTTLSYATYFPFTQDVIGSIALRGGHIEGIGKDVTVTDRFFLGGESFRGFESGGVGPRDAITNDSIGGNAFGVGTVEVRFPLGLPNDLGIQGRVFSEAGTLTGVDTANIPGARLFDSDSIRLSAGVGMSWRSPFGPIRLDFGQAIIKEDFDSDELFRFSFGTRF